MCFCCECHCHPLNCPHLKMNSTWKKNRSKHHNWVNYGAVILFLQKCYFKSVNTVAILTDLKTYSCNLELAVTRLSNFSNCSLVQRKDFERSWTGSQGSCLMYLKNFQWIDFIISFFKIPYLWLLRWFLEYNREFFGTTKQVPQELQCEDPLLSSYVE